MRSGLVVPEGGQESQMLLTLEKRGGQIIRDEICCVRFVKLIGQEGWQE